MTNRFDDDAAYEPSQQPQHSPLFLVAVGLILATIGAGCAFLWHLYSDSAVSAFFAPITATSAAPSANAPQKGVTPDAFQAYQLQMAAQMQGLTHLLESQQADIARLSQQLAALGEKVEALQRPAAPAPVPKQIVPPVRPKPLTTHTAGKSPPVAPPLNLNH